MRQCMKYGLGGLLLLLLAVPAWAQEGEDDDMTMEVVENPAADESEYVDEIALPGALPDEAEADENAAFGIGTANKARKLGDSTEEGRAFGDETAREAKQLGRDADNAGKAVDGDEFGGLQDRPIETQ